MTEATGAGITGGITGGCVAVTGASGFIGRYLCADLAAAGYSVLRLGRGDGMDRQTDYSAASLTDALQGADAVVHLAGRRMTRDDAPMDLAPFWQPNVAVIGDLATAAQANGVRKIILASTIAVYSAGPVYSESSGLPFREDAPARPINAYALSKLMAEAHLEMLTRAAGPTALSLRLAAVYGHGEKGTPALMRFVDQASAGQQIVLSGNPDTRIDQIYVRDATAAILAALRHATARGVFNIGGGAPLALRAMAEAACDIFGTPGHLRIDYAGHDAMPHPVMDLSRAATGLGWHPAHDLRAGLADFRATRDA